jgi:hypothetical protein
MAHPHVRQIVAQKCHCESRKFLIHFAGAFAGVRDSRVFRTLGAMFVLTLISVYKIPVREAVR